MSIAEIIRGLSRLTAEERAAIRQRLRELEEKGDMQSLKESALAMFQGMDKREAEDSRKARHSRLKDFFSAWDASHSVTVGEKPGRQRTYAGNSRLR